jgi:hypothetical protein
MFKKINKKIKKKRGFALLFSVLISSFLLTIGLSIFAIALKELAISNNSRQSIYAYYAAASGLECIKYWDTIRGQIPTFIPSQSGGEIKCGGDSINLMNDNVTLAPYNTDPDITISDDLDKKLFIVDNSFTDGPNFNIKLSRVNIQATPSFPRRIETILKSYGQDSTGGDQVQRAIEITY